MARFQASRPPRVPVAKPRDFTNAEHLDHVRIAQCLHPAVYIISGVAIQGWCDGCRTVARGTR